ncbi:MAG TPA: hypothetical protein VL463_15025 [Kofleriaceae bacterium]|jgi:hypothetical protein|nr:hypothetical protein [Kofleriaceae bacterium]
MKRSLALLFVLAAACTTNNFYNNGPQADAARGSADAHRDAAGDPDARGADDAAPPGDVDARPHAADAATPDAMTTADAKPTPDAMIAPDAPPLSGDTTSCGKPLPTTAPVTIQFTGGVYDGTSGTGVAGATVAVYARNGTSPIASATTDAQGAYDFTVATGGKPIDGYVRVTSTGHVAADMYPAVPFVADTEWGIPVVDKTTLLSVQGQVLQDPAKALFVAQVDDCQQQALAGATLALTPSGAATISYPDEQHQGLYLTSTSTSGVAIANNVTPGDVLVDGVAGATSLRGQVITANVGELVLVLVSP